MGLERLLFLGVLVAHCIAVPLDGAEESACTFKNVTYTKGQEVPEMAPCEICYCESPPEIKCSMIKCQQKNGCKIIQQTNKCCPEYKCECEHEGKTYNNGEKLENPLDPCHVCYCRGGEIMCTSVTCYYREDCEPQYVAGQCCPKYGHCPPVEAKSVQKPTNGTNGVHREMQPWLLTKPGSLPTTSEDPGLRPRIPQTIKIVEILPTSQPPGEVSMVPRIITSDSLEHKTPALPAAPATEATLRNTSMDEETVPDSEFVTTVLPTNSEYNEFNETENVEETTEGSGYDMMSGGTYFGVEVTRGNLSDGTDEPAEETTTEFNSNNTPSAFVNSGLSVPPVLKLNHHLQYLKVGSHDNVTENDTSPIVRIDIHSPPRQYNDSNSEESSQVMLRPEDLKTVAEILINQTIQPVESYGRSKNLTDQEVWAQKVIDRITSNVPIPLQGIELYDNDTNSTTVEPLETTTTLTSERELNDEPASVSDDSSEEVTEEELDEDEEGGKAVASTESSEEEDDEKDKSSEEQTNTKETIHRDPTASRRVRVTDKKSSAAIVPTPFDEHDRFLVENFFKKTLKVN